MQVHYFDADGFYTHGGELPTNPVSGKPFDHNPDVCTPDPLPKYNPSTERARRVAGAWTVERLPAPEPEPEPEQPTVEQVRAGLHAQVNGEYTQRMSAVALPYPQYERESWPIQLQEAQTLAADPAAVTPWIDTCAAQRGLERNELAQRILAKDSAYRLISGSLTGARQAHEDAIDALADLESLQSYDATQGWPQA